MTLRAVGTVPAVLILLLKYDAEYRRFMHWFSLFCTKMRLHFLHIKRKKSDFFIDIRFVSIYNVYAV